MAISIKSIARRWRCDSGAEFVEAAFAYPLLLLLVLGIMDFGLLFQQYEVITNAAREGARIAVLPTYTNADVVTRVNDYLNASLLTVGGTRYNPTIVAVTVSGVCVAQVDLRFDHNYLFLSGIAQYFGGSFGTKQLHARSSMRKEATAGPCP